MARVPSMRKPPERRGEPAPFAGPEAVAWERRRREEGE
jgi:hypothetical protein